MNTQPITEGHFEEPLSYKEIFDEMIDHLNERQLDELIEEINGQKTLIKIKESKRIKMKKDVKAEKTELIKKMKEEIDKEAKELKKKAKKEESEEEEKPKKEKKKVKFDDAYIRRTSKSDY
jgi:hypothetical protein